MAFKQFSLDEQTPVTIYKHKTSRSLRLTVAADGKVRVTIPTWASYKAGLEFARSRQTWIERQRSEPQLLQHGQPVGKAHRLNFVADAARQRVTSRIKGTEITITHPTHMDHSHQAVQTSAKTASLRAMKHQAQNLLPQRLEHLAALHGFDYKDVTIKQLKGRWGSCDQEKRIVLNLYLLQLPWELIDYVILHELTHTRVMRHGPEFWDAMSEVLPDVKRLRKTIKEYQPVLNSKP